MTRKLFDPRWRQTIEVRILIVAVLVALLAIFLTGCEAMAPKKANIPVSEKLSEPAQKAQTAINEANILLTALKKTIADKVTAGAATPDEAQDALNKTREYDAKVDAAQRLLDLGDPANAYNQAALVNRLLADLQAKLAQMKRAP